MSARLLCCFLALLSAGEASAQGPVRYRGWNDAVRPGARVLVTTTDGRQATGRVRSGTPETLTLDTPQGVATLPYDRIARIVVKDPVRNGLLIGLGIGAGAGLAGGLLVNAICVNETGACPGAVLFLTGLGGAIGAGIGAGADGLRQRTVFDRIPDTPAEFVPEVAANVGFGRSITGAVSTGGPPTAGVSWSIRHSSAGWGLELGAERTVGASTRPAACADPTIDGCADAREGIQDLTTGSARAQYFFRRGRVQPYVSAGIVIFQVSVWRPDLRQPLFGRTEPFVANVLRRHNGLGVVAGGGATIQLASHLSLRPDVTYSHADNLKHLRGSIGVGFTW